MTVRRIVTLGGFRRRGAAARDVSRCRPNARPAGIAAALLIGLAALSGLSACGTGMLTQTSDQVAPVGGANIDVGPGGVIQLRNLMIQYGAVPVATRSAARRRWSCVSSTAVQR